MQLKTIAGRLILSALLCAGFGAATAETVSAKAAEALGKIGPATPDVVPALKLILRSTAEEKSLF